MPAIGIASMFNIGIWAAVVVCFLWLADVIGDRRETKVRREYEAGTVKTNKNVRAFSAEEERVSATIETARGKALANVPRDQPIYKATKEQAAYLSGIR